MLDSADCIGRSAINMDNHCRVDLIFRDFAKVFDRIPHQHALSKLSSYGVTGNA